MSKKAALSEYQIECGKLRGLKIALVSDLHERTADDILELLRKAKPDLIAVAGDTLERYYYGTMKPNEKQRFNPFWWLFINVAYYYNSLLLLIFGRKNKPSTENSYRFLRGAAELAPVVLSLGNHEEKLREEDLELFRELKITLLDNSDTTLEIAGKKLRVGGLSSCFPDENWLSDFSRKSGFKLLLCHNPEYFDKYIRDKKVNLTLSGHAHGGQMRIFGRAVCAPGQGFFPKYSKGVYENRLAVCAGCSNTVAIPRIGNPREAVLILFY